MRPSLSQRIAVTVLLGAVLPLGALGLWAMRSAARSGRALLRSQLEVQLQAAADDVSKRWEAYRADLLTLGENEPVREALLGGGAEPGPVPRFVERSFAQMPELDRVVISDGAGRVRWTIEKAGLASGAAEPRSARDRQGFSARVPITDLVGGGNIVGEVDGIVGVARLVPAAATTGTGLGPLTAVFVRGGGTLVPTGVDGRVFSDERIEWAGHHWLAARRTLADPALDLVIAGALEPYVVPFERSAARGALMLLAAAGLVGALTVLFTRRLTREVERELAQREALAAVGEFASELAHEVRNPLTAIRLDLQRVEEEAANATAVRGFIARVLRQIERMDRAVTGALRVARGGSLERRPVDLREVLEAARRAALPEFARRGARVLLEPDGGQAIGLTGDADALEQLFLNLLLNAAQALPPDGEARLTASQQEGTVEVTIADNGAGMTAAQLEQVRQPYRSTRRDGTGLGLKIARRIALNHGGELEIASRQGVGTTVRVRLRGGPPASIARSGEGSSS
jgi:signal transduction histidine kinase